MTYRDELTRAMTWLGEQSNTVFVGQAVAYPGTGQTGTLEGVPKDRLIEFPVAEDFQLGACIGMSLHGFVPISIFPRWNFLLLAANQLVNHLDKLPVYSTYAPHVIVRVSVPTDKPLDPQAQHMGNFTNAFRDMLETVEVIELDYADQIVPAYQQAYKGGKSCLIVEKTGYYDHG